MARYPRVYLAVDNCFASKRWTVPEEWIRIIRKWGIKYIEASADVEADPLYIGANQLRSWETEVSYTMKRYEVHISSIFTGHGSYTTLGLAHNHEEVQRRMQEKWLKPMINTAANLGARFGFFCHALPQSVLHDPLKYKETMRKLTESLAYLSIYAKEQNLPALCIEQMYTPSQPPWTIAGTYEMLTSVFDIYKAPLYLTVDTGHGSVQRRYKKPMLRHIAGALKEVKEKGDLGKIWLGTKAAYDLIEEAAEGRETIPELVRRLRPELKREVDGHPWLFAEDDDGDIYKWIEAYGAYSPIIHMQQTDGKTSAHLPFTPENNMTGLIEPRKFLHSLARSFEQAPRHGMPPMVDEIFLTLEIFPRTAQRPREILDMMKKSVEFWRRYVPDDGGSLQHLLDIEEPVEEIRHPGWMLP
jgi:sugar phosphate isomerase/epimerase